MDSPEALSPVLSQLAFHVVKDLRERIAPLRLAPRPIRILTALRANPGLSQQALGALLGLAPAPMSQLSDDLERRGLVERGRRPGDRRAYALRLTARGEEVVAEVDAAARETQRALLRGLRPEQRHDLLGLLRRLADVHLLPGDLPLD
ncbi:MarR family winged helix-turn-helix transcriptional regulator [Lentzea nigeriaca]|uniref:MarR family winged helix-turn-helix transcriptional regulator n=1 Tax=Lentzea nigeriaca TaxID=1128665 RepID=UPI00195D631D|nr:MarR family transcriptional regulator [Lentzea nigeriaca]MBM7856334.1 DNA-binding MarR family transcriptional regulator [Lentzea nigeriaca]